MGKKKDKWFGLSVWSVNLEGKYVSHLSPLTELKNLKTLILHNTAMVDLSPLKELKNLETLYLSRTQVVDLSPLAELKNLKNLDLSRTQVSDLSPLAELCTSLCLAARRKRTRTMASTPSRRACPTY